MIVKLLIEGGDMKPNAAISQKLGPLGINIGKVIQDINKSTSGFKGMKVPVELDINPKTKNFTVNVFSPPTAELIKKELSIDKGSGDKKKTKVGNLAIEQIIKIAKIKYQNMNVSGFKAAVKSVVGSCVSLGVMIENQEAKEIEQEIEQGKYDSEILQEKTQASEEKARIISEFFAKVKAKQDEILRKEEEAKAAEEAQKLAAETAKVPATTATAAKTATKTEVKAEKTEEKKPAIKAGKK